MPKPKVTTTTSNDHFSDVVQQARTKQLAELGDLSTTLLATTMDFVNDPDSMEFEDVAETLALLAGGFNNLVHLLTVANDERNNAIAAERRATEELQATLARGEELLSRGKSKR